MLYIIATPIGNLSDITFRAIEVLRTCDLILCEDTRHSKRLLDHYQIQKPLASHHKFNELQQIDGLIEKLQAGQTLALISDAGTPTISDPGYLLVKKCREEQISVFSLPGPCAIIAALSVSGLPSDRFQFLGFLPKKQSQIRHLCIEMLNYAGVSISYETPHRIEDTLAILAELSQERPITILRELTKLHEEYLCGTPQELLAHFKKHPPLGEMVLLIEGFPHTEFPLSPEEHVRELQTQFNLSLHEAIKLAASLRDVPKRSIYNQINA